MKPISLRLLFIFIGGCAVCNPVPSVYCLPLQARAPFITFLWGLKPDMAISTLYNQIYIYIYIDTDTRSKVYRNVKKGS